MPEPARLVSRDAIHTVAEQAQWSTSYAIFMAISGILGAVALLTNSVPILIGSMVVAPVLPPLALIAFAVVGGELRLASRGLLVALSGLVIAMLAAMLTTWLLNVTNVIPPETNLFNKPLLEERVTPGWYSVVAAIAAGIAGTFAIMQQRTDTLVGVVAALALAPAAAASAIALISGDLVRTLGGLMLLGINIVLIIVIGVITLLVLRPDQQS